MGKMMINSFSLAKENPEIKEWIFKMDWCKKHQVSPANYYFWNKAKEEYIKQEERIKQ